MVVLKVWVEGVCMKHEPWGPRSVVKKEKNCVGRRCLVACDHIYGCQQFGPTESWLARIVVQHAAI